MNIGLERDLIALYVPCPLLLRRHWFPIRVYHCASTRRTEAVCIVVGRFEDVDDVDLLCSAFVVVFDLNVDLDETFALDTLVDEGSVLGKILGILKEKEMEMESNAGIH